MVISPLASTAAPDRRRGQLLAAWSALVASGRRTPRAQSQIIRRRVSIHAGLGSRSNGPQDGPPNKEEVDMRFVILVGHDEKGGKNMSPEEHSALFAAYQKYHSDLGKVRHEQLAAGRQGDSGASAVVAGIGARRRANQLRRRN